MVTRTRVTLGSRDAPHFVPFEFFDAMKLVAATNSFDVVFHPDTIRYFVPAHNVIERLYPEFQEYTVDLNDSYYVPICRRRNLLEKLVFKMKTPAQAFDRLEIATEETEHSYFLLLPNASYYHTVIWKDRSTYFVLYDDRTYAIEFRSVFVDPHSNRTHVWFNGKPQYQIEIRCEADFRENVRYLKRALMAILPRAFKWDTASGTASSTP